MRSQSLRYGATLCCGLRRSPLRQSAAHTRSSSTRVTVTAPNRSKPLALRGERPTKYADVTVRRSVLSASGGTALSVTGPAARACEALDRESAGEPLVLVVAANQTALRQALGSKALTYSNVIGAVDSLAFAESDQLHVVACKLPPHVEAWTFDAKRGALPDLGRRRLEAALAKHTAPHFLVFGGDAAHEEDDFDDDDGDDDAAALERFARRVDGLFPHGTCAGAAARVNGAVLARISARLVHARRRPGPRKRAKRLKVFAAHKSDRPLVGVALLPREAGADAAAAAQKLGELCFGGSLRFHWAAGDGTSGLRAQRLRSAAMALYDSWDRLDASSLRSLRACVHPGGRPVVGADAAMRSWDDLFGGAIRRRAPMSAARGPARLGLRAEELHVDDSLGLAVGSLSAPRLLGPGGALSSTAVFVEGATGAFEVAHHHASLADIDDASL
ncbi:unnamed protein product [Pelagomonas calceolata]|uniref:FIST domain-containing protein n=1 Tax=Pelagomonas calceolata TaxID=35677 RepID=A0A8J2STC8_9STRA|nr:unnamed protein product [Pelagomonas calceolata]